MTQFDPKFGEGRKDIAPANSVNRSQKNNCSKPVSLKQPFLTDCQTLEAKYNTGIDPDVVAIAIRRPVEDAGEMVIDPIDVN